MSEKCIERDCLCIIQNTWTLQYNVECKCIFFQYQGNAFCSSPFNVLIMQCSMFICVHFYTKNVLLYSSYCEFMNITSIEYLQINCQHDYHLKPNLKAKDVIRQHGNLIVVLFTSLCSTFLVLLLGQAFFLFLVLLEAALGIRYLELP